MRGRAFLAMILLLCVVAHTQNIVDFSYSKYVHAEHGKGKDNMDLSITPNKKNVEAFNFPDACEIARKLSEESLTDSTDLQQVDYDTVVENMKTEFVELLRVSEKIKKKTENIAQLGELSSSSQNSTMLAGKDLPLLEKYESRLKEIDAEIKEKTGILEELVYDSLQNSQNNNYAFSALNFEIESLQLKLAYLKGQQKSSAISETKDNGEEVEVFFTDLKRKFQQESQLVESLNEILENYNEIGILKGKISRLKGELQIAELLVEEKQICAKERDEIKKFQRNEADIKTLMATLRERKKLNDQSNNIYCQGVVKKLEDRVKKVLMTYDYTFECADGLPEIKAKRDADQRQYDEAIMRLHKLENSAGIDEYKKKFDQNRKYIEEKHQQVKTLKVSEYYHNVVDLEQLIVKTQRDLDNAVEKKTNMGVPVAEKKIDYKEIQKLVESIKKLKGNYCFEYDRYEFKAKELWNKIYREQTQYEFQLKMRSLYEGEISDLRNLEMQFHGLKDRIMEKIK